MNKKQIEAINELGIKLGEDKIALLENYMKAFIEKNARVNLISKRDEEFLFEKHVFDSLSLNKLIQKQTNIKGDAEVQRLLDIGTGGGFPSVPLAILYESINVFAIDSIGKKIKVIEELKEELELKNLFPICDRVENLQLKNNPKMFDYITTRAVAPMETILKYAIPNLKPDGYFVAYKSKKALEELKDAERMLKLLNAEVVEIIEYTLPLEEVYERNLIVVKKK